MSKINAKKVNEYLNVSNTKDLVKYINNWDSVERDNESNELEIDSQLLIKLMKLNPNIIESEFSLYSFIKHNLLNETNLNNIKEIIKLIDESDNFVIIDLFKNKKIVNQDGVKEYYAELIDKLTNEQYGKVVFGPQSIKDFSNLAKETLIEKNPESIKTLFVILSMNLIGTVNLMKTTVDSDFLNLILEKSPKPTIELLKSEKFKNTELLNDKSYEILTKHMNTKDLLHMSFTSKEVLNNLNKSELNEKELNLLNLHLLIKNKKEFEGMDTDKLIKYFIKNNDKLDLSNQKIRIEINTQIQSFLSEREPIVEEIKKDLINIFHEM